MSEPQSQDEASTTIGVGGATSGQQGATRRHETHQETGGSGGDGLTRNQAGETTNAPNGAALDETSGSAQAPAEAPDSAMTHSTRGAQDTRPDQASKTGTGLGTPETGGNQDAGDLPPV
ncbi:hypothetical protein [Massilia sp. H6]|uniref:hypothetical protein n=1 Tax=Massilia sp. H6 TaxID=2970464 RepID=UPI0021680089|nr:hypothetical protein [Massilia sp. H6]UVW27127.1 hypothetical protein NRS07_11165 [Massilia sp. H6]